MEIDRTVDGVPTDPFWAAVYHLINVWDQYSGGPFQSAVIDGVLHLPHACMNAGENATDFLQDLGLVHDVGCDAAMTRKGLTLMQWHESRGMKLRGFDEPLDHLSAA